MGERVWPAEERAQLSKRLRYHIHRDHCALIYFVRCGRFVKIGVTGDLPTRFKYLSLASPEKPELLLSVMGKMTIEREYHERFAHLRSNREWFRLEGELVDFLRTAGADV